MAAVATEGIESLKCKSGCPEPNLFEYYNAQLTFTVDSGRCQRKGVQKRAKW
jgi:hypothetical protein